MNTGDSTQKTVLITGATDGLGKAWLCCLRSAATVFLRPGRSAEKLAQLDAAAREKKVPLESVALDVCSDDSVKRGVETCSAKPEPSTCWSTTLASITPPPSKISAWRLGAPQFETNFFGVLRVTRAVLPQMRERRSGRILMMSSISGLVTAPTQGAYSSSKHALEALSNALRMELYPFHIPVVLIEPGYIVTGIGKAAAELSKPYVEKRWAVRFALCAIFYQR